MGVGPVSVGVSAPAVQLGALGGGGGDGYTTLAASIPWQPGLHFSTNVDKEEDGCGGS